MTYPSQEVQWLLTSAWNAGLRAGPDVVAAERWATLAFAFLNVFESKDLYEDSLRPQYDRILSRAAGASGAGGGNGGGGRVL